MRARPGLASRKVTHEFAMLDTPFRPHAVDAANRRAHADPRDPALYHLTIDSTVVPLDTVVDVIERAALSRSREEARPKYGA